MKLSALVPPPGKSKYELSIVAAREARRLNDWVRRSGETLHGKVTAGALGGVPPREGPGFYAGPPALLARGPDPPAAPHPGESLPRGPGGVGGRRGGDAALEGR